MPQETLTTAEFGEPTLVDRSLSERARGLIGSEILKIAGEIREMIAGGRSVCNLTVGDFSPRQFPIPEALLERLHGALAAGETNYPPSNGLGALREAVAPLREFMLAQTRDSDLALFIGLAGAEDLAAPQDVPLSILIPTFITSELKTAFQIGFLIFIPFLVIDMVVSSVLMSMGMMMLSPVIVSLPFKIMLFVLADGWNLLIGSLIRSFTA